MLSRPWTLDRALRRSAGLMSTLDRRLTRGLASWGSAEETGAAVLRVGGGWAAAGGLSAYGDTRSRLKHTCEETHRAPLAPHGRHLPVLFMAELKLLRMDSILARSMLSSVDSELDADDAAGTSGCCAATGGLVLVGTGVGAADAGVDCVGTDATGSRASFLCSSNGESHWT